MFQILLDCFGIYFIPCRNNTFETFIFNSPILKSGEPILVFVTRLHNLAENCNYVPLKEELTRGKIVVGMSDKKAAKAFHSRFI